MNWVFYVIVVIAVVLLWFLCSFVYKPIGKFFYRLYKDARDEIVGNDTEKENKINEEKKEI